MSMNILQQEDLIKGMPDEPLHQEAKFPTGLGFQVPQYLVISEIQRRKDMRERFASQEEQPSQTVADQIVAGASPPQGIGALQPQMPPGAAMASVQPPMQPAPMQAPPAEIAPPMASTPFMPETMAAGGGMMPYRRMANGGMIPSNALVEDQSKFSIDSAGDIPEDQRGMVSPVNMGLPKVVSNDDGSDRRLFREKLKEVFSNITANLGGFQGDQDSLSGRGSLTFPMGENSLNLGMSGRISPLSGDAGIAGLDATFRVPDKNRSYNAFLNPDERAVGFGVQQSFNDGGVVRMQGLGEVPFSSYAELIDQEEDKNRLSDDLTEELNEIETVDDTEGMMTSPVNMGLPKDETEISQIQRYQDKLDELTARSISEVDYTDLIESNRESAHKDALSAALIQLGAGIAGGDISRGFRDAGASVSKIRDNQKSLNQSLMMGQLKGASDREIAQLEREIDATKSQLSAAVWEARTAATVGSGASATSPYAKITIEKFTPESVAAFNESFDPKTGGYNYGLLIPKDSGGKALFSQIDPSKYTPESVEAFMKEGNYALLESKQDNLGNRNIWAALVPTDYTQESIKKFEDNIIENNVQDTSLLERATDTTMFANIIAKDYTPESLKLFQDSVGSENHPKGDYSLLKDNNPKETIDSPFSKLSASDYTPASVQAFLESLGSEEYKNMPQALRGDYSLLEPSQEAEAPSGQQRITALLTVQAEEADAVLEDLYQQDFVLGKWEKAQGFGIFPEGLKTDQVQRYQQAMTSFVNAYNRRVSGAAISQSEMENGQRMFFPQPGNSPIVIEQKRKQREAVLRGLVAEAGQIAMADARGTSSQSEDAARLAAILGTD